MLKNYIWSPSVCTFYTLNKKKLLCFSLMKYDAILKQLFEFLIRYFSHLLGCEYGRFKSIASSKCKLSWYFAIYYLTNCNNFENNSLEGLIIYSYFIPRTCILGIRISYFNFVHAITVISYT